MHISLNSGCKLLFYVEKDYFYCRFFKSNSGLIVKSFTIKTNGY